MLVFRVDVAGQAWFAVGRNDIDVNFQDDPIEFELFKNALFAIADEMALTGAVSLM